MPTIRRGACGINRTNLWIYYLWIYSGACVAMRAASSVRELTPSLR
jgi:hypothetical protein